MTIKEHQPLTQLETSAIPVPAWWQSREDQIQKYIDSQVKRGKVSELARSNGNRRVAVIEYGEAEPQLKGAANFNSAVGGMEPTTFYRREERQKPVLVLLAGVHGFEVEGVMGCMALLNLMEKGTDLVGKVHPELLEKLQKVRLIVIPLANPDGRVRIPYDGFVGISAEEMHKVGQGTRADGSLYNWPAVKQRHPMTGDVGFLGGYFDDAGINLMHDEFFKPMSPVTAALLKLAREEGPDVLLNMHSYESPPGVLSLAYVPNYVKNKITTMAQKVYARYEKAGLIHNRMPSVMEDGQGSDCPPSFNLTSALYHAGVAVPLTFESPHSVLGWPQFTYEQIQDIYLHLFDAAAEFASER